MFLATEVGCPWRGREKRRKRVGEDQEKVS